MGASRSGTSLVLKTFAREARASCTEHFKLGECECEAETDRPPPGSTVQLSSIDAFQETSGSDRVQTLRVVARQKVSGVSVDIVFDIQAGQLPSKDIDRKGICNIISAAR
ncbi:hypothetical protein [Rhizobium sp. B21/90]|uniref:hypothetical protein n=1 Tax=Rhizobium sp. B21/90 TaxID=2819993 RepID=UPI00214B25AA|nr:hypothetical protein [Rhizobium sp. B21/90]